MLSTDSTTVYYAINLAADSIREPLPMADTIESFLYGSLAFSFDDQLDAERERSAGERLIGYILNTPADDILDYILRRPLNEIDIDTKNIPMFSSVSDADRALQVVRDTGNPNMTFKEIGYFIDGVGKSDGANQKYGENHFKLAEQLGLASIDRGRKFVNLLGKAYLALDDCDQRAEVRAKLVMRIPFFQYVLIRGNYEPLRIIDVLNGLLSETTARRRRSNLETLMNLVYDLYNPRVNAHLRKIDWTSLR